MTLLYKLLHSAYGGKREERRLHLGQVLPALRLGLPDMFLFWVMLRMYEDKDTVVDSPKAVHMEYDPEEKCLVALYITRDDSELAPSLLYLPPTGRMQKLIQQGYEFSPATRQRWGISIRTYIWIRTYK